MSNQNENIKKPEQQTLPTPKPKPATVSFETFSDQSPKETKKKKNNT